MQYTCSKTPVVARIQINKKMVVKMLTVLILGWIFPLLIAGILLITLAQAAMSQGQPENFSIFVKFRNETNLMKPYDMEISDNMKNFGQNLTIRYNLEDVSLTVRDDHFSWGVDAEIVDTSTPNIIKSREGGAYVNSLDNYEKQFNTLTNVTTYTGTNTLFFNDSREGIFGSPISDDNTSYNATIFPNGTGTLEIEGNLTSE